MTDDYFVTAIYDSDVKYKLVEGYGPNSFTVMDDGKLLCKCRGLRRCMNILQQKAGIK